MIIDSEAPAWINAYCALGSNLNHPEAQLKRAVAAFEAHPQIRRISVSAWHQTKPINCPPGAPDFLNGAIGFETTLSPLALLGFCQELEAKAGREAERQSGPNAPRSLDVDLLLYGDTVMNTPALALPHPRMAERGFVLKPLAEIAPQVVHPVHHVTIAALLKGLG